MNFTRLLPACFLLLTCSPAFGQSVSLNAEPAIIRMGPFVLDPASLSVAPGPHQDRRETVIASIDIKHARTGVLASPYERRRSFESDILLPAGTPVYEPGRFASQSPETTSWCAPFDFHEDGNVSRARNAMCFIPTGNGRANQSIARSDQNPYFVGRVPETFAEGPLPLVTEQSVDFGVRQKLTVGLFRIYHGFMRGDGQVQRLDLTIRVVEGERNSLLDMVSVPVDSDGVGYLAFGIALLKLSITPDHQHISAELVGATRTPLIGPIRISED